MEFKPLHLLSLIILVLISPIVYSIRDLPSAQKPLNLHFIKDLRGCHKGDSRKGVNKLKRYLQKLGYLKYSNSTHLENNDFDNSLESALKTYQENYHITPSGVVDAATVEKMALSRCGVPDIINRVNKMRKKNHHSELSKSKFIHTVMHYSFFPDTPRWPPYKTHLNYRFDATTPLTAMIPVINAFRRWASTTQYFTFSKVQHNQKPDIVIGFYRGNHGDEDPFDGPGGILAHAFAPTDGRLHFDADDTWGVAPDPSAYDLESVALHEIGHLLGLDHSTVETAVMCPRVKRGESRLNFDRDDLDAIRALYNL